MNHQEHSLSLNPNQQPKLSRQPKWLRQYRPSVTLNDPQYHFISQPTASTHQRVSIKNAQSSRPITMYFEIQSPQTLQQLSHHAKRDDLSKLKSFQLLQHIDHQQQQIVLNNDQTVKSSLWAKQYQPQAFYQLLTDQMHNRNVLTWLKSWDGIVFGKQVKKMMQVNTGQRFYIGSAGNNHNNNTNNNTNNNGRQFPQTQTTTNPNFNNANQQKPPQASYQQQNDYTHNRLILLSGPPGCGKTTLARVVAKHCGYEVMQLNASDDRSAKVLIQKIESLGKNNSVLNGKPTMIVVDQVDGALEQDGNGIKEVLAYLQNGGRQQKDKEKTHGKKQHHQPRPSDLPRTQYIHHQKHTTIPRPIIFICNDPFAKGLRQLRSKAIVIYFRQVQKQRIIKRLKEITQKQKIYIQNQVLTKIAEISNCDIRSSLGILEYLCHAKKSCGQNPKDLILRLKLSLSKDSKQSILQFLATVMHSQNKKAAQKQVINLRQFSYTFSKLQSPSLILEGFFHNFALYKNFFIKKQKETLRMYDFLKWSDVLMQQGFRYNNELDHFAMKHHKQLIHQLVAKWPSFLSSTVSLSTVSKQYLYVLYYSVQTSSTKDSQILDCVSKMITYGIELQQQRNSPYLFKPQFDSLLVYGQERLQVLYSNISRTYIEESYEFAKLKSHLLADMSLVELNKNTEELMGKLDIRNRRRKRNPQGTSGIRNSIKYKFIEGSGTQITYDLKFGYFF